MPDLTWNFITHLSHTCLELFALVFLQNGNTALHEAAWNGYSQTLQILIFRGAEVQLMNKVIGSSVKELCKGIMMNWAFSEDLQMD